MGVVVERIDPNAERDGLNKEQLQTEVELRLRQAGIRVLTKAEWRKTPGLPYLYVRIATHKNPYNLYALAIHVELWQAVLLVRDPTTTTMAPTWTARGTIGSVGTNSMHAVRESVGDDVDTFIQDYLAMNPRPGPGAVERHMPQGETMETDKHQSTR